MFLDRIELWKAFDLFTLISPLPQVRTRIWKHSCGIAKKDLFSGVPHQSPRWRWVSSSPWRGSYDYVLVISRGDMLYSAHRQARHTHKSRVLNAAIAAHPGPAHAHACALEQLAHASEVTAVRRVRVNLDS